ncbi:MAG: hypothetical protein L0H41_17990, partial [Microlunatus sp.]|nr:hypothetical protein [Microlunatus sp.]
MSTKRGQPQVPGDVEGLLSKEEWEQWCEVEELMAGPASPGWPAEELAHGLTAARRGLDRAGVDADELVGVFDQSVTDGLEAV